MIRAAQRASVEIVVGGDMIEEWHEFAAEKSAGTCKIDSQSLGWQPASPVHFVLNEPTWLR